MKAVAKKAMKKTPTLYVGQQVRVKDKGKVVTVDVVEIDGDKFCADFGADGLRWISVNTIVK